MTHRLKKASESLRRARNVVAGILIGTAFVTPVFAAAEITRDDWTTLVLLGSVVLLGVGLLLRIRAHPKSPVATLVADSPDSIGHYRPQIHRP
jgi:hypothetical protein